MPYSIIIPSCNINNFTACVTRLRDMGETGRVIAVWDHGKPRAPGGMWAITHAAILLLCGFADNYVVYDGHFPFCFARNCNIGIRAAGTDDVILLNDDVLLETQRGLACLGQDDWGIVSPRVRGPAYKVHAFCQMVGAPESFPLVTSVQWVPFVCVFIRRALIDAIGELDEQFTPGGYEDNDYCRRAIAADFRVGVHNHCMVDHQTLPHTFRPDGQPQGYDLAANARRYAEKWRTTLEAQFRSTR